jgi:CheY-like chemotaxis protein
MRRSHIVLVAEDQPDDVEFIRVAFEESVADASLWFAADGQEAIEYLAGQGRYGDRRAFPVPDLLLLDLKLPRKSGLEVLSWLRQQAEPIRRLPVLVLTSSNESGDIDAAFDRGANSYLVKPVELERLAEVVRTIRLYWLKLNQSPTVT